MPQIPDAPADALLATLSVIDDSIEVGGEQLLERLSALRHGVARGHAGIASAPMRVAHSVLFRFSYMGYGLKFLDPLHGEPGSATSEMRMCRISVAKFDADGSLRKAELRRSEGTCDACQGRFEYMLPEQRERIVELAREQFAEEDKKAAEQEMKLAEEVEKLARSETASIAGSTTCSTYAPQMSTQVVTCCVIQHETRTGALCDATQRLQMGGQERGRIHGL
eukprot:g12730.t1